MHAAFASSFKTVTPMHAGFPSSLGLDAINVAFLKREEKEVQQAGKGCQTNPLLITPRFENSLEFLSDWLADNRSFVTDSLHQYGAVFLRGFDINDAVDLEKAITSYEPDLCSTYRGTSPRNILDGTEYIFSAAESPVHYPIAQHIEMSFQPAPPSQLYFGCLKPSASAGGETAVCDFRCVYNDIPSDLREKLLVKRIRYQRTNKKVGAYFTYDISDMVGWPAMFGTDSRSEVERICKDEDTPVEWIDGDTFRSTSYQEAFQLHPITREPVYFNHSQVFHWTTFPAELWFAWQRTHEFRIFFHFLFVSMFCIIKYGLLRHEMSLHTTFGDGTPISVKEMHQIRKAIHKNMVFSRWEKGDVLLLDNFSTSHGRQPTFDKGRKIAVAWANPVLKANKLTMVTTDTNLGTAISDVAQENPQEKTPDSTLNHSESQVLLKEIDDTLLGERVQQAFAEKYANPQQQGSHGDNNDSARTPSILDMKKFWTDPTKSEKSTAVQGNVDS